MNSPFELEALYVNRRSDFLPWEQRTAEQEAEAEAFKVVLGRHAGATFFGKGSFISPQANVFTETFEIGENSWVAAGAILRGNIKIGSDCSINPYAHIAGKVDIGDRTMIAGGVSIYGFNHGHKFLDLPMRMQAHTIVGVNIMNDVWIGANVTIVDGVNIGAHSIVAGGAVVTKSCPEYSVIGGVPARIIRSRLDAE